MYEIVFTEYKDNIKYEYIDIPFCGDLTTRVIKRATSDDGYWYEAEYDDEGYCLRQKSSHTMLCGSKFFNILYYKGSLIYRRDEHHVRISHHNSGIEFIYQDSKWKCNHFSIGEEIKVDGDALKKCIEYVITKLKGTIHSEDIEYLEGLWDEYFNLKFYGKKGKEGKKKVNA